jgi:hypothetical protein
MISISVSPYRDVEMNQNLFRASLGSILKSDGGLRLLLIIETFRGFRIFFGPIVFLKDFLLSANQDKN